MTINIGGGELKELKPRILVLGVGGAGGNAIDAMITSGLQGVEFVAVNTDAQDLKMNKAQAKIQLGSNLTKGLGAGAKVDIGQAAADESLNEIVSYLQGSNMVFITAGMGGGTGTGAAHVIARAAKELNILTVGVVTLPFLYEGPSRMNRALGGLEELKKHVDTNIVIPNQNLFKIASEQTTFEESFDLSNRVLKYGVQSITDLMVRPGLINLDFADVETVMSGMGKAMMGTGEAEGEKRSIEAAEKALNNPLIDEYSLKGAKGLLVNITGGKDLKLFEVDEAVNKVRAEVDSEAELIIGAITDPVLEGKMRVSIVATALDGQHPETKSVVSMVHRIQNRNNGYGDNTQSTNPVINSPTPVNSIEGATALNIETIQNHEPESIGKTDAQNDLETDLAVTSANISLDNANYLENNNDANTGVNQEINEPNLNNKEDSEKIPNFEVESIEEVTPELFPEDKEISAFDDAEETNQKEDDFEIPAFLRKQKN